MDSKRRLEQYIKEDTVYNEYLNSHKSYASDFDRFCIQHCEDIKKLLDENQKQKEEIDDYKEDILNLLDVINKNCNELKCTSDEWLVIQKYQDKEVSE